MSYFDTRYHPPGTAPGTLIPHREVQHRPLAVTLVNYNGTHLEERQATDIAELEAGLDHTGVTWLHLQGHPDVAALHALAAIFDLHQLALEDVLDRSQQPKLERYGDHFFLTLRLPDLRGPQVRAEQISLFLGKGFVLSFHAGEIDPFEPVRQLLRGGSERLRQRPADYLLYTLVDLVIDHGFPVLEQLGEQVEDLELELLDHPDHATLNRLHQLKRDLLLLRRLLWPQRELINLLLREEHPLLQDETKLYFRDCYDHSFQILDLLETYREMTADMLEVYLSSISHRLNEIMRLLTVISTIFIPLTFIAGVYGMNFGRGEPRSPWAMPELDWYFGYPLIWLVMAVLAIGMALYFRYKRWF
jgi:magnesium transporter